MLQHVMGNVEISLTEPTTTCEMIQCYAGRWGKGKCVEESLLIKDDRCMWPVERNSLSELPG